jgi:N4-gp56 family major capsid protein
MATNTSSQFQADIQRILDKETLEVAQRFLVIYQFSDKKTMPKDHGTSWTATRFNRLPLPLAPLSEGVPPIGETLTISQVTGVALQWGDKVTFTDVATITIQHDLLHEATERLGMQVAELRERNGWNAVLAGTQVNYVNQRGARASLVAGDVLDPNTVNRTVANLKNLGAPMWSGQTGETVQRSIDHNARGSSGKPMTHEHYVAVGSPLVFNDFASNPTVVQAWSYSDITRLYINETGYWRGMHFCETNMVPTFVGLANNSASASYTAATAGSLATGTYIMQITGWDTQNQYETRILQVSAGVSVTGPTGSVTVVTPSTTGFTYAVYISQVGSSTVANLGVTNSTAAPSSGPYTGQAIQIPPATTLSITNIGLFQVPPAAPATGVTVFPTVVFGQRAFAALKLENISWTRLFEADKSDPMNQLRVIGYKFFEGWVILNNQFLARIESTASNTGTFG